MVPLELSFTTARSNKIFHDIRGGHAQYRKLPLISPGLVQLRKGVLDGLINGGVYIRGGGGGYNRTKKPFRSEL